MDIEKTKSYYEQIGNRDLCDCAYCQNYISEVKAAYPKVAEYLSSLGIDIEKPFETMFLEPDEAGYIEYLTAQYIVYGEPDDFVKTVIGSVNVDIAGPHPSTQINEAHFVIGIYPVRLKWVIKGFADITKRRREESMENFNTLEKVQELFRNAGCRGKENCYFVTYKDEVRSKSGVIGGMEYPYFGLLINQTEEGIGLFYLDFKKMLTLKSDISNMKISEKDAYHFIPNADIKNIIVKKNLFNSKVKSITIQTCDRKHRLLAKVDEPLIPYHNENLMRFESRYTK